MSRQSTIALSITVAICVAVAGLLALPYRSYAQAPAKRGVILDNARVTVQRVTQPAGTIEKPHPHPEADYLSIQLTPGSMEVTMSGEMTKGTPGTVWYLPKNTPHTMNNIGTTPVEIIVVTLK
jgi:quercetin dioxygenase-like cupin family protein